jgi:hypothetical protein
MVTDLIAALHGVTKPLKQPNPRRNRFPVNLFIICSSFPVVFLLGPYLLHCRPIKAVGRLRLPF